jgi:transcriptional regulator with XRE-family HTH domain
MDWESTRQILRALREDRGIKQYEFAQELGVHQSMVSNWEVGFAVPRLDNLITWVTALHCRLDIQIVAGNITYTLTKLSTGQEWA